jgi:MoxR-like ATPase
MFLNENTAKAVEKISNIRKYLQSIAFERELEIEGILLATLSKTSCFFYGDVGTAKTFLIRNTSELLGLSTFDILMSETTKPDAIFGPIDVPGLANGVQRTKYQGYAPDSEILFFDEIFKANSTVLNPLLWLINEKQYRNGDEGIIECPVRATFAASNEVPSDEVLKAIYDRLLLRYEISYIKSSKNLKKMIESNLYGNEIEKPEKMTHEELDLLYSELKAIKVSEEIFDAVLRIKTQVEQVIGIGQISDRRLARAFRILQAKALLRNDDTVQITDLEVLSNLFWNTPDQIDRVTSVVLAGVNASAADLSNYIRVVDGIWAKMLKSGNIPSSIVAFEGLIAKIKEMPSSSKANSIIEYTQDKLDQALNLTTKRAEFIMIRVPVENGIQYTINHSSSILWTPSQLRSVGFHFSRKSSIWLHNGLDTKQKVDNQEEEEEKIKENIKAILQTDVTIQDF